MVTLKEGDMAPAFSGLNQDGEKISLADFKGAPLLLYFYPEADTPTCTIQSCSLRDHYKSITKAGLKVLGVSPDKPEKLRKFREKYSLPFDLLSDSGLAVLKKYGVWDKKKMFGHEYMGVLRTSFLLNEEGRIIRVFLRPKNKEHGEEVMEALLTYKNSD